MQVSINYEPVEYRVSMWWINGLGRIINVAEWECQHVSTSYETMLMDYMSFSGHQTRDYTRQICNECERQYDATMEEWM